MASSLAIGGTLRHLRDLFHDGTAVGLGDGQLLARYAASRDEAAFEALVARHGPMVLATCRAVLRHEQDVEDAFQATFLVLAEEGPIGPRRRRPGRLAAPRRLSRGGAGRAPSRGDRRRREAEASAMATTAMTPSGPDPEIPAIVHEEVDRLPEKHRLPVVLCDLEGLTYEQAAGAPAMDRADPAVPAGQGTAATPRAAWPAGGSRRGRSGSSWPRPTAGAKAAVPAALARSAVAAATGGTASATAAALSAHHHQEPDHDQAQDRRDGPPGGGRARLGRCGRGGGLAARSAPGRDASTGRRRDEAAPGRARRPRRPRPSR